MNEGDARRAAGEWLGLINQAAVPDLYNWLATSLKSMLSEDATVAAVSTGEGVASIVALEQRMLIVLEPEAAPGGAHFAARALPLNEGTTIDLEETLSEDPPRVLRTRVWRFRHGEEMVSFTTTQFLRAMFADEAQPPPIEILARMAAGRLGWGVPS